MSNNLSQLHYDKNELFDWASSFRSIPPEIDAQKILSCFYNHLPRVEFLKTLPANSILLDAGAGDGGLNTFRDWLDPARNDLTLWGTSLGHSGQTSKYDFFSEGRIGEDELVFPGKASAFIACHLIEHLKSTESFFQWIKDRILCRSPIYIEWPSWHSQELPKNSDLTVNNLTPMTLNFYDDETHLSPLSLKAVEKIAEDQGFTILSSGLVGMQYYADFLRDMAFEVDCDTPEYLYTIALWQKTYFSCYIQLLSP